MKNTSSTRGGLVFDALPELPARDVAARSKPAKQELGACRQGAAAEGVVSSGTRSAWNNASRLQNAPLVFDELPKLQRPRGGAKRERVDHVPLQVPALASRSARGARKRARIEWADQGELAAMRAAPSPPMAATATEPQAAVPAGKAAMYDAPVEPHVQRALDMARAAATQYRMPSRPQGGFTDGEAREAAWIDAAATRLASMMEPAVQVELAGGELAVQQMGGMAQAATSAAAVLRNRAGRDGSRLFEVIKLCVYAAEYGKAMGFASVWPVRPGLCWLLANAEHRRATAPGNKRKGSRGGATVGHRCAESIVFAATLGLPFEYDKRTLDAAAPPPAAGGNSDGSAGTIPPKATCHLEATARGARPSPQRFWARSLLLGAQRVALRCADGVRLKLSVERESDGVVILADAKVPSSRSKDGMPIQSYAYAEGITGPYEWAEQHVQETNELGQVFPGWLGPKGAQKDFSKATELTRFVVAKHKVAVALRGTYGAEPLCMSPEEIKALGIKGHSMHGTEPDLAQTIGEWPTYDFPLEEQDEPGFSSDEVGLLGNWLRLKGKQHDARPEGDERRAAATGVGVPEGAPNRRGQSQTRYVRGDNRLGARTQQLRLRRRLQRIVRAAVVHAVGDVHKWMDLPEGADSSKLLASK